MTARLTAGARADLSEPADALRRLIEDSVEMELGPEPTEDGRLRLTGEGWSVEAAAGPQGLSLRLDAVDGTLMRGVKEMAIHLLARVSPEASEALRWSDGAVPGALPADLRLWTWLRRTPVAPGLDRLTFATEDAARYAGEAMHVRLLAPPCDGRAAEWPRQKPNGGFAWPEGEAALAARVYTVRRARPELGEVDVDVVDHGPDLLAGWVARARPGWRLGALGPSGGPPPDDGLLIAGADLCALPALARLLEAAPRRRGIVVAAGPAEAAAYLAPPPGVALRLMPPETPAEALAEAYLAAAAELSGDLAQARWWFAAEAAGARRARAGLDGRGVDRRRRDCVAYWRA
ncbi:siderophore-interacting protein [Albimonas sp. CAU 1670]|uniref:siderophore-interacting protein n=1 Tax=Albimonas sp. CAU 1670 TaxID=3032599 RepID=UPI0023DC78FB|nr:siderophore-interacting protein [Albimonas sp. CAU 1670]MDF2235517.1 siderophore-interacting protein [Albimonas sp. CAU 1670]